MKQTLDEIRRRGLEALRRELGPAGMVRFLQQFDSGHGDYARERHEWVDRTTLDDIRAALPSRKRRRKRSWARFCPIHGHGCILAVPATIGRGAL